MMVTRVINTPRWRYRAWEVRSDPTWYGCNCSMQGMTLAGWHGRTSSQILPVRMRPLRRRVRPRPVLSNPMLLSYQCSLGAELMGRGTLVEKLNLHYGSCGRTDGPFLREIGTEGCKRVMAALAVYVMARMIGVRGRLTRGSLRGNLRKQ